MSRAGPGGAVRHPDPDHHRRAAVGDRHRRHGPPGALQRAGHVRPRRRGGGRRRHAAARQDRHDHAGQPPGDRVPAGARRRASASWPMPRSSPRCRDETPEGRSIVVLAKEKYSIRGREMAPLHARFIPFTAQTRMSGVDVDGASIRKGAVDAVIADVKAARGGNVAARGRDRSPSKASPSPAARRWPWPRTARCSASSISRTSSRAASSERFATCAGWASAPS